MVETVDSRISTKQELSQPLSSGLSNSLQNRVSRDPAAQFSITPRRFPIMTGTGKAQARAAILFLSGILFCHVGALKFLPLGDSITFGCGDSESPACKSEGVATPCTITESPCASCAYGYRVRLFDMLNTTWVELTLATLISCHVLVCKCKIRSRE
jgi:hypothetical protein